MTFLVRREGPPWHHSAMLMVSKRRFAGALVLAVATAAVLTSSADAGSKPSWMGSKHVKPAAYHWATGLRPADTYDITVLRGVTAHQVLRRLGQLRKELGAMTYQKATDYALDRLDTSDYSTPTVVQVSRLGHSVVVYEPVSDRGFFHSHKLTRHASLASFITDVDLDTYVKVARDGSNVRRFDPSFRPPRAGALPEERGLHFGEKGGNVFERSWAFIERITLTHVSRAWFDRPHPTYVLRWRT
jgi:Family of unknown function (DUF6461)